MLPVDRWDNRTRLTCWAVKASMGCIARTVGLAQPFPQLADGLMHLLPSFAVDLVDPGFEVGRSAL
jgi:hypothetical protein